MSKPLSQQARDCVGKNHGKAGGTNDKNIKNMDRLMDRIEAQTGLQSINDLKTNHFKQAFEDLKAEGLAKSTLEGYASVARDVAEAIGKANIMPRTNAEWDIGRSVEERYCPKVTDPTDQAQVREALAERSEHLALAHDMREAFGLRAKESLLSVNVVERNGKEYLQVQGAKGGRPREVEIRTGEQRQAAAAVREYVDRTGQKSLCPMGKTLKQSLDQQRNAMTAIGATKANGTNMHTLRHAHVQERRGKEDDRKLVQEVGHNRTEALNHYSSK